MSANVDARRGEHVHLLLIDCRILFIVRRIAFVAGVDARQVLVPVVVHPRRACAAAAVDVELHAAGHQPAIAQRGRQLRRGVDRRHGPLGRLRSCRRHPQRRHAHGQLALVQQLLVEIPLRLVDVQVLRARHPFATKPLDDPQHVVAHVAAAAGRPPAPAPDANQTGGALLHHPGRITVLVAVDRAASRIRGLLGDTRELHRERVGHGVVAGRMVQIDGIVRRRLVEIRRRDVAALGEFAFVPAAAAHPRARRQLAGPRLDLGDDLVHVARIAEVQRVGRLREVHVRVDQARRGRAAEQVDHLGLVADERLRAATRPDKHNLAVTDRHGLRHRVFRVNGDDDAVRQHEIGRRRLREQQPAGQRQRD